MRDSVEERILKLQDKKRRLAEGALSAVSNEDRKQLRIEELRMLLNLEDVQ